MDMRTGRTYETKEAALAAGVPESDIAEVTQTLDNLPEVKFSSGPFKDRTYKRTANGQLVRVSGGPRNGWIEKTDGNGRTIRVKE